MASCAMLFSATMLTNQVKAAPNADWMSSEFGVSWRHIVDPNRPHLLTNFDVPKFVNQVKSIPRVKYVIINLSRGAYGDLYLSPHSVLSNISPTSTPAGNRDLFMELAQAFKAEDIKVMGYIACQGPALLKHGVNSAHDATLVNGTLRSQAMINWRNHVRGVYGNITEATYKKAFGEIVFEEYAKRYGTLVDGWWFDNGSDFYDARQLFDIAKKYNPRSTMASNGDKNFMGYRNGHPIPMIKASPSDNGNLDYLLRPIEATPDGYFTESSGAKTLGHMYMPIQRLWTGGDIVWSEAKALNWKHRCLNAGGAWTWNVNLDDKSSLLNPVAVDLITRVANRLGTYNNNSYPLVQIRKRNAQNFCLNGYSSTPFPGQNVRIRSFIADHPGMTWEEIDRGNGFYSYQRVGTNYSIDGGNGGMQDQNVYLWETDANNYNQHWKKVAVGGGYYKLEKRNKRAFSINGGPGGTNNQNVNLWDTSNPSQNLQWKFEYR